MTRKCKNDPAVQTTTTAAEQHTIHSLPPSQIGFALAAVTSHFHIHIGTSFHHFCAHCASQNLKADLQNQTKKNARREHPKADKKRTRQRSVLLLLANFFSPFIRAVQP